MATDDDNDDRLRSGARQVLTYVFWGAVTGLIVHLIGAAGPGFRFSWTSAVGSACIGTVYVALMSGFMHATGRLVGVYVPLESKKAVAVHTLTQAVSVLVSFILVTAHLKLVLGDLFSVTWYALLVIALVAFSAALIGSSFTYMQMFHQRMREAEAAAYEAKLRALRAQINPHFLFNAFNSIAALIRTRPEEAETVLEDLADLYRYTLRASKQEVSTLRDEVEAARLYLAIGKARFRRRLTVDIDLPENLLDIRVPSMILQPLVENAVKHGVAQSEGACTIALTAQCENETLRLRVTDTGPGFDQTDPGAVGPEGTGLPNVRERLHLSYGEDARMEILAQGVELQLPRDREIERTLSRDPTVENV